MTEKVSGRKYGALAVSPCYHPANKPFSFYYKTCRNLLQNLQKPTTNYFA